MRRRSRIPLVHVHALATLVITGLLVGCVSASTLSAEPGETVEVTLSSAVKRATVDFGARRYRMNLVQIVDSRCPANAKCIWAGELAARISIARADQPGASREITLGSMTVPSLEIMGIRLDLVRIDETSVTVTVKAAEES